MTKILMQLEEGTPQEHPESPEMHLAGLEIIVFEEILIQRMMREFGKSRIYWKKILAACIKDAFITALKNERYDSRSSREVPGTPMSKLSRSMLQVSPDKGTEIINGIYFWLKYIPGQLRPLEQVVVQVGIAVLTAIITAKIIVG